MEKEGFDMEKPYLKGLTYKQKLFVELYDGNATQTARKAGYKGNDNTLAQVGNENLRKPQIIRAIQERDSGDKQRKSEILNASQIRKRWSEIIDDPNMTPSVKLKALDSLARSQGLFLDRVEMRGQIEHLSDRQLEKRMTDAIKALGREEIMRMVNRAFLPKREILEVEEEEGNKSTDYDG